jgi:hypothetical protein
MHGGETAGDTDRETWRYLHRLWLLHYHDQPYTASNLLGHSVHRELAGSFTQRLTSIAYSISIRNCLETSCSTEGTATPG